MAIIDFYEIGANQIYNNKFTGYAYLHFDVSTPFYFYMEWKKGIDGDIKKGSETYRTFTKGIIGREATGCAKTTEYYWRICIRVSDVTYYTDWNTVTTNTYLTYAFLPTDPSWNLQTLRAQSDDYSTAHNAASGSMIETNQIGQQKWSTTFRIYRSPGIWDTTGIIPEGIVSVALCGYHLGVLIASFKIVVQSGQPDFPHDPVVGGDYNKNNYGGIGGESETLVAGKGGCSFNLPLGEGFFNWIQNGKTKLMLRSSKEMEASAPTASDEYIMAWPVYLMVECLPPSVSIISFENSVEYPGKYKITGNVTAHGGKALIGTGYAYNMSDPETPSNPSYVANTELGIFERDNIFLQYRGWKYYVWACAYNGQYGYSDNCLEFWTPVRVQTYSALNITYNSAYLRGKLTNYQATILSMGFEYYEDGSPEDVETVYYTPIKSSGDFWKTYAVFKGSTTYYYRAFAEDSWGRQYGTWVEFTTLTPPPPTVTNIGAENNRVFARTILTGEISGIFGTIVERGFEYKIQDAEPGSGDTGTEVKETNAEGFDDGEYSLRNKELYDQQYIADNIIWWFRAYCKDDAEEPAKSVASSWMKNLPHVITQAMANINYNKADGNGIIISKGASDLTERGFEVKHEYSGTLRYSWKFDIAGFEGELECVYVLDDLRVVIDVKWEGELIKTALETYELELGVYTITIGQMVWGWPLANDCLIEGESYTCRAFASNEFGTVYGEEVNFNTWARTFLAEDFEETVGETTVIENELIKNLPEGVFASRRGFRYGTTEAADEFDIHEDGSFTNGSYSVVLPDLLPETTYYVVAYIVVNGITYEGDLKTKTTSAEGEEDSDEYPTPHFSPHGQDYREIETKVFAEVLASQGIIDFSGGKKTLSITNHLIQDNPNAKVIADNYLNRFKLAKTRMTITFPTPLPFEREDTVDFSFGVLSSKEDDEGIVNFKEDGEGVAVLTDQISMIIKRINSVGLTKTLESTDYTAVLDLEHE
jgi:hypothetical protein